MPTLETIEELVEALATEWGIYNQGLQFVGLSRAETHAQIAARQDWAGDHADTCQCRMCWCGGLERRIREAVANEVTLAAVTAARRKREEG